MCEVVVDPPGLFWSIPEGAEVFQVVAVGIFTTSE